MKSLYVHITQHTLQATSASNQQKYLLIEFDPFKQQVIISFSEAELQVAGERLAEPPAGRHDVGEDDGLAVGDGDPEGQPLAVEVGEGVPVGSPVARHGHPVRRPGPPHVHGPDGPRPGDVGHQHQVEVVVPVDGEAHPSLLHARHPAQSSSCMQIICSLV